MCSSDLDRNDMNWGLKVRLPLRVSVVLLMLMGLGMAAPVAYAAKPDIQNVANESQSIREDACGPGIDIIYNFDLKVRIATFLDKDGAPIKQTVHEQGPIIVERSDSTDTFRSSISALFVFDLIDGTTTATGKVFADTLPGSGLIIQDVGRVVFDDIPGGPGSPIQFIAGFHEVLLGEIDILEVYCEILAP